MPTVDELLIQINATTASLERELKRADQAVGRSADNVQREARKMDGALAGLDRSFGRISGLLGVLGVGLGVNALVGLTRSALDAAGGLGELAQQTGVGVKQLQVLAFAATQAGLSTAETNTAIGRLSRSIGEAAQGQKEYADAFARLGVSIRDASGNLRSTEEVLADVSDAIARLPDPAARAAAAADLFGRAGQRLLPILEQGAEGMARYEEQARALGLVLSDEQIAAADKAGDAWAAFDETLNKVWQGVVADVAPAFSDLFETLSQPEVIEVIEAAFRTVAFVIELAAEALRVFAEVLGFVGGVVGDVVGGIGDFVGWLVRLNDTTSDVDVSIDGVVEATRRLNDATADGTTLSRERRAALIEEAEQNVKTAESVLALAEARLVEARAAVDAAVRGHTIPPGFELLESEADLAAATAALEAARETLSRLGTTATSSAASLASAATAAGATTDAYAKLIATLRDEVLVMERELDLLGLSATERDAALKLLRAEMQLRAAGRALSAEEQADLERLIGLWQVLTEERAAAEAATKATDHLAQLQDEADALYRTGVQQAVLTDLRAAGFTVTGDMVTAEGELAAALGDTAEAIAAMSRTKFRDRAAIDDLKRFRREVQQVAGDISRDFTEAVYFGFRDGFDSVDDFLETWLDRLALQILEQQFVLPITAQLVGLAPGLFGVAGPRSAAGGITAPSAFGGEVSGLFDSIGSELDRVFGEVFDGIGSAFDSVFGGLDDLLGSASAATASADRVAAGLIPGIGDVAGPTPSLGLGDLFGGAGTGLAIGSLLGAVTGGGMGSSFGGAAGGLIGAGLGSIIPGIGTVLGSIIGSIGGGLFGGLFGGGSSVGPNNVAWLGGRGGLGIINTGADNGGSAAGARDFGNAIIDLVERSLGAVGGDLGQGLVQLVTGSFSQGGGIFVNPTGIYGSGNSNPNNRWFGEDQEAAAMFAASVILQQAGVEGIARGAVRSLRMALEEAADTEELESFIGVINLAFGDQAEEMGQYEAALTELNRAYDEALEVAEQLGIAEERLNNRRAADIRRLGTEFVTGLNDAILQATDPEAFALLELDRWREAQIAEAEALGRGLVQIERLYGIRRQQIAEQFAGASADDFLRALQDDIRQIENPRAAEIVALNRWRREMLAQAEELGIGMAEIEELYGLRRQQIIERYAQRSADTLQRLLDDLTRGELAGLSPRDQLRADQRAFDAALDAALTGGTTDEEQAALADAASALLRTAQEFFSFSPDYFALRDQVESALRDVLSGLPGFAGGTGSTPAGVYWVGEQGPELMVGEGAQIIPHPASVALMDRMAEFRMPALPTFDLGGGGEGLAAGLTIDFAGVEQAVREGNAINAANGREFAKLSERVTRLEQENARLRSTMQPVAAAAGRNLAQPSGGAGPRRRNAA